MMEEEVNLLEQYFSGTIITVLTEIKADTKSIDDIAKRIAEINYIEDVFIVTGDCDIIVKAKFPSYADFRNFLINELTKIDGVNETKTMFVVSTYKERGIVFEKRGDENGE